MKKVDIIIYSIITILVINIDNIAKAQTPNNDPHWEEVWFGGNFKDSGFINLNSWYFNPPWGNCAQKSTLTNNLKNHVFIDSILNLVSRNEVSVCTRWDGINAHEITQYTSGGLFSKQYFKYGYFEIKCKIPELTNNDTLSGKGFSPCFWLWPYWQGAYDDSVKWSEIDIFEIDGENNLHTCNVHYQDKNMKRKWMYHRDNKNDFTVNFDKFHTFACEWDTNSVKFFHNDTLITKVENEYIPLLIPMSIIVWTETPAENFGKDIEEGLSLFPYNFEVEYVKVYHLKYSLGEEINEIKDFDNYNYTVKKSISLGKHTKIPENTEIFLRATDSIELKPGFKCPLGTSLYLDSSTPINNYQIGDNEYQYR